MITLAVRGVLARRAQSLIAILGLAVTLVGFSGLVAGADSTTARLDGDIRTAWDTPFDLLVRPPGTAERLERTAGLVRPNYVSGIHGGITGVQLADVRAVPGVRLAAPLAAVGAVSWPSAYEVRLPPPVRGRVSVHRVTASVTGQAGLSAYPVETRYVVIAPRGRLVFESARLTVPGRSRAVSCSYPVNCFAGTVCFHGECARGQYPGTDDARYYLPLLQPVQVAGIDPRAEARLTGLDRCVTTGRHLTAADRLTPTENPEPAEVFPVLASSTTFLDQALHVQVDSARLRGTDPGSVSRWTRTDRRTVGLDRLYRDYLAGSVHDYLDTWPVWSAGDVRYRTVGRDHLAAEPVPADPGIYQRANSFLEVGTSESLLVPPEVADPWLRPVTEHADTERPAVGSAYRSKIWDVVGQYDPACLAGFDPLAGATLEAYAAPDVRLPDGRRITPSRAIGDYVASPPLLLTTLRGARWLADPQRYAGQPGDAYISVIRVRVSGTGRPGPLAQRRLVAAAVAVHDRTGLRVDVVKGASTRTVRVDLPAGTFGRPAVTVQEQWSVKGAALRFSVAVRGQDRALLWLLLGGAGVLVGQAAFVAVRQRRTQLAVLRALGWSPLRVATLVELETLVVGLTAGAAAVLGAVATGRLVTVSPAVVLAAPALGLVVAGLAGLPSAWAASRGSTVAAMSGGQPVRRSRPPATTAGLAVRELRRAWPVETAVAVLAVAMGAGLVGLVVLVAAGFRARLDTTVLGVALQAQVRPFHLVLASLTLALGAAAAAQVVLLGWLSRRPQLGVLRALGWSGHRLAGLVCWQAAVTAVCGLAVAAPGVLVCAVALRSPASSTAQALAVTAASCLAAGAVAAAGPGLVALRTPALRLLARP